MSSTPAEQKAAARGLPYLRNDNTLRRPFSAPPAIVNFFYHEEIKKSAKRAFKNGRWH